MFFTIKCPYCKERVKKKAVRCKHCKASLGGKENTSKEANDEGLQYLQNGFNKINAECDIIEQKINARTGFIFITHQYSNDDLYVAIGKIKSFVGKMKADLDEWESVKKLSGQVKAVFNRKAGEAYRRLEAIQYEIERREPTFWEKVRSVFKIIFETLIPFLSFRLVSGESAPKAIAA